MMTQANRCVARAGVAMPELDLCKPLPAAIQWMPPGSQVICPFVDGVPCEMTVNVTSALACQLNDMLQKYRQLARAGQGDTPFIDFNHNDAEAAGEVTELFWGGDDPQSGGIRAKVIWSEAGERALRGKMYRRFSPQWFFDPQTQQPDAIGVNLGGLVNRAAFKTIRPVMARDGQASKRDAAAEFVQQLAARRGQFPHENTDEARSIVARQNPTGAAALARLRRELEAHPFLVQARAVGACRKLPLGRAQVLVACADFELYRKYCAATENLRRQLAAAHGPAVRQGLMTAVTQQQRNGVNFDDALRHASRAHPDLVAQYRDSFR